MLHTHHIIPKHAGGTDDPSNLVQLTVEEHAQAHKELFEKYGITYESLKSGEYKDIGSPFKPLTEAERRVLLQKIDVIDT